ncbi:PIG-L deacetylase family protein [Chloroflexota bacterium]
MVEISELGRLQIVPEDWKTALAIVAHPDDIEYGVSSAVARWTSQGKKIAYVLLTRGEAGIDGMPPQEAGALREKEERESAKVVGVNVVEFLDYQDGVIEYSLMLRKDLARVIRQMCPEIIITINHHLTFGWGTLNMADHRWVGLAVMDAARDAGNRWIFPELLEEGLKPWDGVKMVLVGGSPIPTHGVDVSDFIDRGVASLEKHRTYIDSLPVRIEPSDFLRKFASEAGQRIGCEYAVTFEVITI